MCENADAETFCATIESGRQRGRIIVAAKASFVIQYFVSVSRKSFLHSLDQTLPYGDASYHDPSWGEAEENGQKADIRT